MMHRFIKYVILLFLFPAAAFGQKQGREAIDSMVAEVARGKHDTNEAKLLCRIAFFYYSFDPVAGIEFGKRGLALSQQLAWAAGVGFAYNALGVNSQVLGKNADALDYYQKSLKVNEEHGNKRSAAQNLGNIGMLYYTESDYPRALDNLFRALKMFEELKDDRGITVQLCNIANAYDIQKMLDKALHYDSMALDAARHMGDRQQEAVTLGNMANIYQALGDEDKALIYHEQALAIFEETSNQEGVGRELSNAGTIYFHRNDFQKALASQLRSLKISEELNNVLNIAMVQMQLAECYYRMATYNGTVVDKRHQYLTMAAMYMRKAMDVHKRTNNIAGLSSAYRFMADVNTALGDHKTANLQLLEYVRLNDSVFTEEHRKKVVSLEHQRELDVKENSIKMLAQQNKLKDLRADKERLTRRVLIASIALVLVVACSVVMYFVRRQRSEKLLANERINTVLKEQELRSVGNMLDAQEEERKRIAADLHDRLGSMLSTVKLYFNSVEEQIDELKLQNQDMYHKATSLLDDACDEVRKISHNLVSGELVKFGLVSALDQLKGTIERTGRLKIDVLAFGMDERLNNSVEISLYRIVQELMNNILKHAHASQVVIQLNRVADNLNILVEDNGIGFDIEAATSKGGMGLTNMDTRVKKMNGTISVDSAKDRGTTTIIDIPV